MRTEDFFRIFVKTMEVTMNLKQLRILGPISFAMAIIFLFSLFPNFSIINAEINEFPFDAVAAGEQDLKEFDVIVVGSDPEGIAAAISASRNNLETLLIDTRDRIGGLMTIGWLNSIDMNYAPGPEREILNEGLFTEFYTLIEGDSFAITTAQNAFDSLVAKEDHLHVLLNIDQFHPIAERNIIKGINVTKNNQTVHFTAKRFIDATQDADLAYMANVPFTIGQEDYLGTNRSMAATLVFKLDDVDWNTIYKILMTDDSSHSGANNLSAWGFFHEMKLYQPKDLDVGIRGLNIGREDEDTVLINALYVFGVDGLDAASKQAGIEKAKKELEFIVPFMNKMVPGFEKATLAGVAPELYIRETRHMKGLYRLTIDDVLENRDFEDRIALGSYPVDIQSFSPAEPGYIVGDPAQYAIPFRSIVPPNITNLLVVSRSASYDSLAHGTARVIPVGMATGQAAGVASAYSIIRGKTFQEMANHLEDIQVVQAILNSQGMKLQPFSYPTELVDHWAYEGVKFIRSLGMISAGYNNDYLLDQAFNLQQLNSILYKANIRLNYPWKYPFKENEKTILNKELFASELLDFMGKSYNFGQAWNTLKNEAVLSDDLINRIEQSPEINRAMVYMAIYEITKH